jgi:uncharacterized radical SAM superfamily protein
MNEGKRVILHTLAQSTKAVKEMMESESHYLAMISAQSKHCNFIVEKPTRHHVSHMVKVNTSSIEETLIMILLP